MNTNPVRLPVSDTLNSAWTKVGGTKLTFLSVFFLQIVCQIISSIIGKIPDESLSFVLGLIIFVVGLAVFVVYLFSEYGLIYLGVKRASDSSIDFNMIKNVFTVGIFFKMIWLYILWIIVFIPSIILFYLPSIIKVLAPDLADDSSISAIAQVGTSIAYLAGFILSIFLFFRLYLSPALVIVDKISPWKAVKVSFRATKSNVLRLFLLFIVMRVITILSAIPIGIGLFWTVPMSYILYGEIYKKLMSGVSLTD